MSSTLLEGAQVDAGTGDASGNSRDMCDADAVPNGGGGMSPPRKNSQNMTNEAIFDETVIIIQDKYPVQVAANSGVDAGLDRG